MPASVVKADYEQLQQIAAQFEQEADQIRQQASEIKAQIETLRGGDWEGIGADLFYREMDDAVLPSFTRLSQAMTAANRTTLQILRQMQQAEDESAQLLLMRGGGGQARGGLGQPTSGGGGSPNSGNSRLRNIEVLPMSTSDQPVNPTTSPNKGPTGIPFVDAIINDLVKDFEFKTKFGEDNQYGVDLKKNPLFKKSFWGGLGEIELGSLTGGIGLINQDGKWILGPTGEISGATVKVEGTVYGDKNFGPTNGIEVKILKLEGLLGYKDGKLGSGYEANLASVKIMGGQNIAGWNVGMSLEAGWKLGAGGYLGKDSSLKLGPFSLGFTISDAKN